MGGGFHGGFWNTYGAAPGDAVFQSSPHEYFQNISHRPDIDYNGVYDVVAHGGATIIQISHNGHTLEVDSRVASRLIKTKGDYNKGQPIRLLSCSTGSSISGFAQNLANKLNVVVEAPTSLVWAYPNGRYIVAPRRKDNPSLPDLSHKGKFKKFYPGGNKHD